MIEHQTKVILRRHMIRWRLLATVFTLLLTLIALFTGVQLFSEKAALERQQQQYVSLLEDKLHAQAVLLIDNLARVVENHLSTQNMQKARALIESVVQKNDSLDYAILMRDNGHIAVNTRTPDLEQTIAQDPATLFALQQTERANATYQIDHQTFIEFVTPMRVTQQPWGALRLGMSMQTLLAQIAQSEASIRQDLIEVIIRTVLMAVLFLFICSCVVFQMAMRITKPIVSLVAMAQKLAQGDYQAKVQVNHAQYDEITVLADAFATMAENISRSHGKLAHYSHNLEKMVAERTAELENAMQALEKMASTDQLTGTYNRRKFDELFPAQEQPVKRALSLIIIDIDHFKQVNDTYGHNVGDDVLKQTSQVISDCIRLDDMLFRWGGEEFIVLVSNANLAAASVVAEKIRQSVAEFVFPVVDKLTISLGVTEHLNDESIDTCVSRADAGLYEAKENGRNRVVTQSTD